MIMILDFKCNYIKLVTTSFYKFQNHFKLNNQNKSIIMLVTYLH